MTRSTNPVRRPFRRGDRVTRNDDRATMLGTVLGDRYVRDDVGSMASRRASLGQRVTVAWDGAGAATETLPASALKLAFPSPAVQPQTVQVPRDVLESLVSDLSQADAFENWATLLRAYLGN